MRRLWFALSLVVGADLILFLTLDSGLVGDPALIEVGPRASATDVGLARLRLGHYEEFDAQALRLQLSSTAGAMDLRFEAHDGSIQVLDGTAKLAAVTTEGNLTSFAAALSKLSGDTWSLQAFAPEASSQLGASGVAAALHQLPFLLQDGAPNALPWAQTAPKWKRFLTGFSSLLHFDFGNDRQGRLVSDKIRDRGKRSLMLSLPAFTLSTVLALALAMLVAARRRIDRSMQTIAIMVVSVSSLAWILFLRQSLAVDLAWFPMRPWSEPFWPLVALPILIWVWISTWPDFLLYRTLVLERSNQEWMTAARARGLSKRRIWLGHLLPNLAAPLASLLCITLPFLVLGSLLLEYMFDIPGLGNSLVEAVKDHDTNLLRALTFLFAVTFLLAQWLGEAIAVLCDPRLKRSQA
ncbi:MAG: ABC transporter permease [Planctomycetota bacterium]|nr:ABC transporter permease [Planctomycetota bacterium]MDA1113521.1 ABC transporter permease [Planctomycetota bacterium]